MAVTALANFDMNSGLRRLVQPTLLLLGEHFPYAHYVDEMLSRIRDVPHDLLQSAGSA